MFATLQQRLLLGVYIFVILSIPVGAYFFSQQDIKTTPSSQPQSSPPAKPITKEPSPSPKDTVKIPKPDIIAEDDELLSEDIEPSTPPITTFGPTLSFKVNFEGRGANNHSGRLFIGILEGGLTPNPKFLLSYTVDLPASGEFSGLSLAGLDSGVSYTAILKGPSQIATSSAFVLSPKSTTLNSNSVIFLTSGDLNDDNIINTKDYSLVQTIVGSSKTSQNWNENSDLNKDGVINALDIGILSKNFGKTGASGAWVSPLATSSASLLREEIIPMGSADETKGYWIWIPK